MGIQKAMLRSSAAGLRERADRIYGECLGVQPADFSTWVMRSRPFHWFLEFPHIVNGGGFSVIVGNPPYVQKSKIDSYDIIGYTTDGCPDIYAQCYERSLQLLERSGRHAFVVMISLAFGSDFESLRRVISSKKMTEFWSTYGKRPNALFVGAQVCNTILILAPGTESYSTAHQIFSAETRSWLFRSLEYFEIERVEGHAPLRGGIANVLVEAMNALPALHASTRHAKEYMYVKNSGRYWFPAMYSNSPSFDRSFAVIDNPDPNVKVVPLGENESSLMAVAICGGMLGYLWWSATGDDLNTGARHTIGPRKLVIGLEGDEFLDSQAQQIRTSSRERIFASVNAGKVFLNVRWNSLRSDTSPFDRRVLELSGLDSQWRSLSVWYRQTMRSSGENTNTHEIPAEVLAKYT
jgi:hypothetical protein